jgi:hypothetical protein
MCYNRVSFATEVSDDDAKGKVAWDDERRNGACERGDCTDACAKTGARRQALLPPQRLALLYPRRCLAVIFRRFSGGIGDQDPICKTLSDLNGDGIALDFQVTIQEIVNTIQSNELVTFIGTPDGPNIECAGRASGCSTRPTARLLQAVSRVWFW